MSLKSFNFDMILLYAMMQFSKVCNYLYAIQELPYGINKVLLQKTFQSSMSLPIAFLGLIHRYIISVILISFFLACAPSATKEHEEGIALDEELLEKSDYLDIVYENGRFSYVSYLTADDIREEHEKPLCSHIPQEPETYSTGIWIWDYRKILGREKEVVERLSRDGIKKVYLQIGDDLNAFRLFLMLARAEGMNVFALDGAPDYIDDYSIIIERMRKIKEFNGANRDCGFNGIQIDIEPYLKKDFNIKKRHYLRKYLDMAGDMRLQAGETLKLSFALPFWFDGIMMDEKPLSSHIIDIADEVAVMSYRTDYSEVIESAANELCYAEGAGKPVFLGLEINRLPDEKHFIVKKDNMLMFSEIIHDRRILLKSPDNGLPVLKSYEVKAEKITFMNKKDELMHIMREAPVFRSFGGYVIHSFEGLYE